MSKYKEYYIIVRTDEAGRYHVINERPYTKKLDVESRVRVLENKFQTDCYGYITTYLKDDC